MFDYKGEFSKIESRARDAISASDIDALVQLDKDVVELLGRLAQTDQGAREASVYQVFLQKLSNLYQQIQSHVEATKSDASEQLKSITESQRGIKAYQQNR